MIKKRALESASLSWDGQPRSDRFDDPYASAEGGVAETTHVFLKGNRVEERWKDGERFVVGETGFGMGLNFCTTVAFWKACGSPGSLHYYSIENYPVTPADLKTFYTHYPDLVEICAVLLDQYPPCEAGSYTIAFPQERVTLTLLFTDVLEALHTFPEPVDCWFLDGFSPQKNSEMWSAEVLSSIGHHTKSGGTVATYTAAGHVKRGLEGGGFVVKRVTGFGKKKHMITGYMPTLDSSDDEKTHREVPGES